MEMKRYAYTPVLGWSFSRYETFSNCKRKYFYNYYGKHDTEFNIEKIEFLKGLTSIPFEIGTISHDVIEVVLKRLLKTSGPIDRNRFELYLEKHILTKLAKNFFETYYGGLEKIELDQLLDKTKRCLNNFLASNRFEWIRDIAIAEKDNWLIEPPGYGESRLDEMKLYCKVDFLTPLDGKIVILDWKTGKKNEEKHSKQLVGYASWALHNMDMEALEIEPIMVYLFPEYDEITINVNEHDLKEYKEIMIMQTREMYNYCSDYEENQPLAKEEFPMVGDTKSCKYCNYKELCCRD